MLGIRVNLLNKFLPNQYNLRMKKSLVGLYYLLFQLFQGSSPKNSKLVKIFDPYTHNQHSLIIDLEKRNHYFEGLKNGKVMDVGSGSQWPKKQLENSGWSYQGCDIELSQYSKIQDFILKDEKLPVESDSYDVVLCLSVLEHLTNPSESIHEMHRILKPGGFLVLQTNFLYPEHGAPHDYFRFTLYGLSHLINKCKFNIKALEKIGNRFTLSQHILLYSAMKKFNSVLVLYFSQRNMIRIALLPIIMIAWILNLLITPPLFSTMLLQHILGGLFSKKINLNYTGLYVIAQKIN